ncbi:MAG: hypothetical protein QXG03_08520 [Halalkalicoccus sp.]
MFRRLRETGPVVLVPLAWSFASAAHLGWISTHAVVMAHVVMSAILAAFALLSWSEMEDGVLRVWRTVLVVGLGLTLVGLVGLRRGIDPLLSITVLGWMLVPGAGLAVTGRAGAAGAGIYLAGAAMSVLGALAYAVGLFGPSAGLLLAVGLALVGVGQTAGIANAVYREA